MYDALMRAGIAALRRAAANPVMRKKLGQLAVAHWDKIAASKLSDVQKQRGQQALAVELARQVEGGKLSYSTLIESKRYTVVWADGQPLQAFPPWKGDLGKALSRYKRDLLVDPPKEQHRERRVPWRRREQASAVDTARSVEDQAAPQSPAGGRQGRTDETGAAFAGSQLQTQLWVNRHPQQLGEALGEVFPELAKAEIEWRSPLADESYAEQFGASFLRAVDLGEHRQGLKEFWPARGPQWDALAIVRRPGKPPGVLLVEGKSYPDEMLKGSPTTSKTGSSNRQLIDASLAWTRRELGVGEEHATEWCGALYQNANRLAHLLWLRDRGVDAWLVHLLFTGDQTTRRTERDAWEAAVLKADQRLGLPRGGIPNTGHVLLAAGTYEDLTGQSRDAD